MRSYLIAICLVALLLGSHSPARALPLTGPPEVTAVKVEKIDWVRRCDRDGDRCRRVWVRDRDDWRGWRWWRWHRRDRD